MSAKIESASIPVPPEVEELVLLETLKALLSAAIRALSRGEAASLEKVSYDISATAGEILSRSANLSAIQSSAEVQRERQKLLIEMRRQRSFCCAMLRRWRRSILLSRQLLDLAGEPSIYTERLAEHPELP